MKLLRIGGTGGATFTLLKNIEDVRAYVDNYNPMNMGFSVGLGDLSLLTQHAQAVLLKFIEEGTTDIFCYASRDNVSPVLMSRFDKIEKIDDLEIGEDDFADFVQWFMERELSINALERSFVAKAGGHLDSFLVFRRLPRAVVHRIGKHL